MAGDSSKRKEAGISRAMCTIYSGIADGFLHETNVLSNTFSLDSTNSLAVFKFDFSRKTGPGFTVAF